MCFWSSPLISSSGFNINTPVLLFIIFPNYKILSVVITVCRLDTVAIAISIVVDIIVLLNKRKIKRI